MDGAPELKMKVNVGMLSPDTLLHIVYNDELMGLDAKIIRGSMEHRRRGRAAAFLPC